MRKTHTNVRLNPESLERLRTMAETRSTNVTALISEAVERFLREESFRDDLASMEQCLAATIVSAIKETARVGDDVQLLIGQVDQLMKFVFQATPEIFDKDAAAIVGSRRYTGFLESFGKEFVGRKRRARFAAGMDQTLIGGEELDEK